MEYIIGTETYFIDKNIETMMINETINLSLCRNKNYHQPVWRSDKYNQ